MAKFFAAVCAAAFLFADAGIDRAAAAQAALHSVVIDGLRYAPETITVKRGETIVWVNNDPFPHTVTAQGVFDSGEIPAGKVWEYTPRRVGRYAYICTVHPNMKGTLQVE